MLSPRSIALLAAMLALASLSAERVRDPTKRLGAGPLFQIRRGDRLGYIDRTGRIVIRPRFYDERDFFHGLAGVLLNGK